MLGNFHRMRSVGPILHYYVCADYCNSQPRPIGNFYPCVIIDKHKHDATNNILLKTETKIYGIS